MNAIKINYNGNLSYKCVMQYGNKWDTRNINGRNKLAANIDQPFKSI